MAARRAGESVTRAANLAAGAVRRWRVGWLVLTLNGVNAGSTPSLAQPKQADRVVAITDVRVVDVRQGRSAGGQTVLVTGARITAIGPASRVVVPAGARRLSGAGRWLIPGLWDMHVHTSRPERDLPLYLANGVTGVRDMGGEDTENPSRTPGTFSVEWSRLRGVRDGVREGRVRGPRIVAAGVMLDGPTPWPGTRRVEDARAARAAVRERHHARVDFIKIGTGVRPDLYPLIAGEARSVGLPLAGHVPSGMSAVTVAESGQGSLEHLMGLPPGCFDVGPADNACTEALRRVSSAGAWMTPTLTAWRGRLLPPARGARLPELQYVGDLASGWAAAAAKIDGAARRQNARTFGQFVSLVGRLPRAGIGLLAGTDSANAFVVPGFALHEELALLAEAGLAPAQILAAATLSPARFLNLDDDTGDVAVGKRADLVLLAADPLRDIRNTSRIVAVIVGGEVFDRSALDRLLAEARVAR